MVPTPAEVVPAPRARATGAVLGGAVVLIGGFVLVLIQVVEFGLVEGWARHLAFVVVALIAAVVWCDPAYRLCAVLLTAAAAAITLSGLDGLSAAGWGGYWTMVGWLALMWPVAALLPVFLIYPATGFQSPVARWLSVAMGAVVAARLAWAPLWRPSFAPGGAEGTLWVSYPWASESRLYAFQRLESVLVMSLALAAVFVLHGRWRRASGPDRRPTRTVALAGVGLAVSVVLLQVAALGWLRDETAYGLVSDAALLVLSATPLAIVGVVLGASWRRLRLTGELLSAGGDAVMVQAVLREALDDPGLRLHLRAAGEWVDAEGHHVASGSDEPPVSAPLTERRVLLRRDGTAMVTADIARSSPANRRDVEMALSLAGLALDNTQLARERRAHLAALRSSRSRVVEAELAERRRLERDLHDGVQQYLLAASASLSRAQLACEADARDAAFADARSRIADTMREVRALGRGLHPSALSQGGLPLALPGLEKADGRVVVDVGPDLARGPRPDPDVEIAVYFAACELLTNAVRHATPSHIRIVVETALSGSPGQEREGVRLLVVTAGSAAHGAITELERGLVGVRDRVEALEGSVNVQRQSDLAPDGRNSCAVVVWVPSAHRTQAASS